MLVQNNQGSKYASELRDLMDARLFYCVYQPIVSLTSGCTMGWEALLRGPEGSNFHHPDQIFRIAEASDCLAEIEIMGHRAAVSKVGYLGSDRRLFLKAHPHVIHNTQFVGSGFVDYLSIFNMTPQNIVFEITERQYVDNYKRLIQKINSLRSHGFSIAVDDVGSGYAGLQAIGEIRPDYLKIDMSLVQNIHRDRVKMAVLEMLVAFTEKIGGGIIAEGVESDKELYAIMKMNIHFGQGYFIGKQSPVPEISGNAAICRVNSALNIDGIKIIKQAYPVGDFTEEAVCADHKVPVKKIKHLFDITPGLTVVVITEDDHPVGLVMRNHLDSHLGKKYGFSLYSERAISTLMDSSALMVDENTAIEKVARLP